MKYYAVKNGRKPGIYTSWDECKEQVEGYPKAEYKSFKLLADADEYMNGISNKKESTSDGKYYAVKNGKIPGIYLSWDSCREQTDGYPGAKYKSFLSAEEAARWLKGDEKGVSKTGEVIAYVDGSFNASTQTYGAGLIILGEELGEEKFQFCGNDSELAKMRNVAGEILAAQKAMEYCFEHGIKKLEIRYDYEGIEKWCIGAWKANKPGTIDYRNQYRRYAEKVQISFLKVTAHSNNTYNDAVDAIAKKACGV